jgi:hypothetical protein
VEPRNRPIFLAAFRANEDVAFSGTSFFGAVWSPYLNAPVLDRKRRNFLKVTPVSCHHCAAGLQGSRRNAQIHLGYAKLCGAQLLKAQNGRLGERQDSKSAQRCRRRRETLVHGGEIVNVLGASEPCVPAGKLLLDTQYRDDDIGWRVLGEAADDGW